MKIYDGALKILKALVVEFRKENMTDEDIIDGFDFSKKILERIPIISKSAKESLNKALEDTQTELRRKK